MKIPNYLNYDYSNGMVTNLKKSKAVTKQLCKRSANGKYKLKSDSGSWHTVSHNSIAAMCGQLLELPKDAKPIPFTKKLYIDKKGVIYSFSRMSPAGKILTHTMSGRYPCVNINFKGRNRTVEVHQLMCVTFILEDYIERGLVCLHADDNKFNCSLDNLSVGTYSKNNEDAYATGVNQGNGLKK